MPTEQLVRSCLYNWLGYGKLNSPIWFMGMEEGGAEIWSLNTRSLDESLHLRSQFDLAMDFRTVWEDTYGIPLSTFRRKGLTAWHFMAAFLLGMEGLLVDSSTIRKFVFEDKLLGRTYSNHFMCEFLPLPRASHTSMDGYKAVWKSPREYEREVTRKRLDLIKNTLIMNRDVKLLVSYDRNFTSLFIRQFPSNSRNEWRDERGKGFVLYKCELTSTRTVHLLSTPFFGNGQANYGGLVQAAERIGQVLG